MQEKVLRAELTERQLTILSLLKDGLTNPQIAMKLGTTTSAIGHAIYYLNQKLGTSNRTTLVTFAIANGLVVDDTQSPKLLPLRELAKQRQYLLCFARYLSFVDPELLLSMASELLRSKGYTSAGADLVSKYLHPQEAKYIHKQRFDNPGDYIEADKPPRNYSKRPKE